MSMAIKISKSEHRGDPGLFGFLGKAVKGIGGLASNLIPGGGIARSVISGGLGLLAGRATSPRVQPGLGFTLPNGRGTRPVTRTPGVRGLVQRFVPGGKTGFEVAGGAPGVACPAGYHPNKTSYYTSEGFVAAGSKCVRNRSRNPLNQRAASRAISRIAAGKRANRALNRVTIRKSCD